MAKTEQLAVDDLEQRQDQAQKETPDTASDSRDVASVSKTVTVHCAVANGIHLSIDRSVALQVSEGGDGYRIAIPRRIKVNYGPNPGIDAAFWTTWLAENRDYSAVLSGHIFAIEDI